jgi:hypothetical protein
MALFDEMRKSSLGPALEEDVKNYRALYVALSR